MNQPSTSLKDERGKRAKLEVQVSEVSTRQHNKQSRGNKIKQQDDEIGQQQNQNVQLKIQQLQEQETTAETGQQTKVHYTRNRRKRTCRNYYSK